MLPAPTPRPVSKPYFRNTETGPDGEIPRRVLFLTEKRITALALAIVMVMGTVALAAGTEKTISVTPTKSNGEAAEVFAYDGATYVPLRYLSELLGIQVEWDKNAPSATSGRTAANSITGK